ncbi:MAG: glycosyl hydrolase [Solirubrobacteraceae bacterium]
MRRLASLVLPLAVSLAVASSAAAKAPMVGIGDQNAHMFSDPAFQALGVKRSRLALAWDWHKDDYTLAQTDRWMAVAQAAGVRPLIAFNRNWRAGGDRHLPSVAAYRKSFRLFRARYPSVREFSAWNEANHSTQPTYRKPKAAARLYKAMRADCRRCTIVAADVLDSSNMIRWLERFKRHAPRARLWGLHNYKDANDRHSRGTKALLKAVRGRIWLTETGGILRLRPHPDSRGKGRKHTRAQQAGAVEHVYRLARRNRRVARIYFYEWQAQPRNRWDSAFVNANGTLRPAYYALKRALRQK